ncbi:deoxyguanosinetriphosphate triphosphohydrolase [Myxococcota bacterium]|nr:deoxyguanosinetriphosphate triphosphohydrolase [Myxococcota bacterium]
MPMEWKSLLSANHIGSTGVETQLDERGFGRDYSRILFSRPFRRLLDKTQVFPMPVNDHVHNRLIHSVEVSSVGRQLGALAEKDLLARKVDLGNLPPNALGDIVASACLMHDIGNPPFGHAGEDAIASWFRGDGKDYLDTLDDAEKMDLQQFEGNAQSFRVVSRLEMYGQDRGGMQLSMATLGAVAKYPQASFHREKNNPTRPKHVARKKFSYFQAERVEFESVATGLGLSTVEEQAWVRHPLTYLVEAADDICYSILDLEDGFTLGLVPEKKIIEKLNTLLGRLGKEIPNNSRSTNEHIAHLRGLAIGHLIKKVSQKFNELHDDLLAGQVHESLVTLIEEQSALKDIGEMSKELCYNADEVIRTELVGYEVLGGLLDIFVPAVLTLSPSGRQERVLKLMPIKKRSVESAYSRLLRVTDYLSGMTDGYALRLYKELRGIELPGVQGRAPAG